MLSSSYILVLSRSSGQGVVLLFSQNSKQGLSGTLPPGVKNVWGFFDFLFIYYLFNAAVSGPR